MHAADLDGDGDNDVLSTSWSGGRLLWHENDDGAGSFGPGYTIAYQAGAPGQILATDLDQDGMLDVVAAYGGTIAWYRNPALDPLDADMDDDGLLDGDELAQSTDPRDPDSDGDGVSDGDEVNFHGSNPLSADTDGDGLGDGDEIDVYGTSPVAPDSDGDLLLDGFEVAAGFDPLMSGETHEDPDADGADNLAEQAAGSDPLDPDSDGDSVADGVEVGLGTDPLDPSSYPSFAVPALPGAMRIGLAGLLLAAAGLRLARRGVHPLRTP